MLHRKYIALLLALLLFYGCSRDSKSPIQGVYQGFWGETEWIIALNGNQKFVYKISGHAAMRELSGEYEVNGDTVLLRLANDSLTFINGEGQVKKMLSIGDSCLIDLNIEGVAFDYCKIRPDEYWTSREWNLEPLTVKYDPRDY